MVKDCRIRLALIEMEVGQWAGTVNYSVYPVPSQQGPILGWNLRFSVINILNNNNTHQVTPRTYRSQQCNSQIKGHTHQLSQETFKSRNFNPCLGQISTQIIIFCLLKIPLTFQLVKLFFTSLLKKFPSRVAGTAYPRSSYTSVVSK